MAIGVVWWLHSSAYALRSQVCFAAAVGSARPSPPLASRAHCGFPAEPPAATRQQRVPSFRRPLLSRRVEALYALMGAGAVSWVMRGQGRVRRGAASSRSRPSPGVFEQTRFLRPAAKILVTGTVPVPVYR
jgi:hypothetical protein